MKLATRINSYFRDGDKNLDRVFAEFQSVGLTHVDLNYPEHCTGVTAEDMAAKLAAHELQLNGCALASATRSSTVTWAMPMMPLPRKPLSSATRRATTAALPVATR